MSPPVARGRARAAHLGPEKRRPLLLDTALRVFAEHGFAGASVDDIADAAGVTKPVVYACFAGKRELFDAVLAREEERLIGQIVAVLPARVAPGDLEQTLVDGFTAYFQLAAATPDSWRLVFDAEHGADPMVSQRIEHARRVASAGIAGLAEELLAAAGVDGDAARRAELEAHVLVATAEAAVRLMLTKPGVWTPEMLGRLLGRAAAVGHSAYVETV